MDNTITLASGQKIEILLQDEVTLDIDCSLRYIKSGETELAAYVQNIVKPQLDSVVTAAQSDMNAQIAQGMEKAAQSASEAAEQTIDENISEIKNNIIAYVDSDIKPELQFSVQSAAESASIASDKSSLAQASAASAAVSAQSASENAEQAQIVVAEFKEEVSAQFATIDSELSAKLNRDEADYIVENYYDDEANWYLLYKSGWIEQGGRYKGGSYAPTINLLKPMQNTTYNLVTTPNLTSIPSGSASGVGCGYIIQDTSSFIVYQRTGGGSTHTAPFSWRVCGQSA